MEKDLFVLTEKKKKERQRYAVIYCVVSHNRAENTAVFTEWYF